MLHARIDRDGHLRQDHNNDVLSAKSFMVTADPRFHLVSTHNLQVTGISLLSYAATVIGGPLQCLARYDFASAALSWQGEALFA